MRKQREGGRRGTKIDKNECRKKENRTNRYRRREGSRKGLEEIERADREEKRK